MIFALIGLLLGLSYSGWRIWTILPLPLLGKALAVGLWVAPFVMMLASFWLRPYLPTGLTGVLYRLGSAWPMVLLYVVGLFLVADVLRLIVPSLGTLLSGSLSGSLGMLALVLGIFAYANYRYHDKVRVEMTLQLSKPLPRPLKIVALSDLHMGHTIRRSEVARWVDMINKEDADLILIAGDLIDSDLRPVLEEGAHLELNRLKARLGVYACLGNHEYIDGEARLGSPELQILSKTNVHLLRDEAVLVDNSLYIVGRDDRTNAYRSSTYNLLRGIDESKPIIVLDHQPHDLGESELAGVDLQLSGHTHRGQIFPLNLIVDRLYEHSHGYYRRGNTHYYVSSGMGLWGGKFRIGTQSEYLVLTLTSSQLLSPEVAPSAPEVAQ